MEAASSLRSGPRQWHPVNLCCILVVKVSQRPDSKRGNRVLHFFGRYVKSFWGLIALIRCRDLKNIFFIINREFAVIYENDVN